MFLIARISLHLAVRRSKGATPAWQDDGVIATRQFIACSNGHWKNNFAILRAFVQFLRLPNPLGRLLDVSVIDNILLIGIASTWTMLAL